VKEWPRALQLGVLESVRERRVSQSSFRVRREGGRLDTANRSASRRFHTQQIDI
jgi:hypothetical protein